MDEQAMEAALADMRERRVESWRSRIRRDVAVEVLTRTGSVTVEQVEAELAKIPQLSGQALADQIAAKAAAAVDFKRRELQAAQDAVDGARSKVAKCEALLDEAQTGLEEAQAAIEPLEQELQDAQALAEFAARRGDPAAGASGEVHLAPAGVATGKGGA